MSCDILWDPERRRGCFWCNTGDVAFGPIFDEREVLEVLDRHLQEIGVDPRKLTLDELIRWQSDAREVVQDAND
jgi:hypothetical protein